MTTPRKIRKPWSGSKVGVIAPANSMVDLNGDFLKVGTNRLNELGFDVKLAPRVSAGPSQRPASIQDRVYDFNSILDDEDVSIIMPVFGGYNSLDLLDYLPYDQLRARQMAVIGFSDTTILLNAINVVTGLITLHGPSFASFCEPYMHSYTIDSFKSVVGSGESIHCDPQIYADDSWYKKPTAVQRQFQENRWKTLRAGVVSGRLIGGNTSTLLALAGTRFFPNTKGSILMLEESTDTTVGVVDRNLSQLNHMGVLDEIAGLILGKPGRLVAPHIPSILEKHCSRLSVPVLYDVNCSHVDPLATFPIGAEVTLDATLAVISHSAVVES